MPPCIQVKMFRTCLHLDPSFRPAVSGRVESLGRPDAVRREGQQPVVLWMVAHRGSRRCTIGYNFIRIVASSGALIDPRSATCNLQLANDDGTSAASR